MKVYLASYLDSDDETQLISIHSTWQGAKNACYERELAVAKQEARYGDATLPEKVKLIWDDDQDCYSVTSSDSVLTSLGYGYMVEEYESLP